MSLNQNIFGDNVGNLVFSHASHKILSAEGTEITPNRFRADPRDAGEINEKYDVFVIPLANAIRRSYQGSLVSLTKLIERLKIPGGGARRRRADQHQGRPGSGCVRWTRSPDSLARAVLDRSPTIGVRGKVTAEYLRTLGFKDVDVIGCPSMFIHGEDFKVEKKKAVLDREDRVAINISPYVKSMGEIVVSHHQRYPNLEYIPQDLESLDTLLWGDRVGDRGKQSDIPIYTSHPLYQEQDAGLVDPWTWMDYLSDFQFAFGTRIHGNITALISGVPCYLFAHDSRTLDFPGLLRFRIGRSKNFRPMWTWRNCSKKLTTVPLTRVTRNAMTGCFNFSPNIT